MISVTLLILKICSLLCRCDVLLPTLRVCSAQTGGVIHIANQVKGAKFSDEDIKALTHRIQFGGDEVVNAKEGAGSATLSMVSQRLSVGEEK